MRKALIGRSIWFALAAAIASHGNANAAIDLTGDGVCDVVRFVGGNVSVWGHGANSATWTFSLQNSNGVPRDPLLIVDGPQRNLLVLAVQNGTGDDTVYALNGATGQVVWQIQDGSASTQIFAGSAINDHTGDGVADVLLARLDTVTGQERTSLYSGATGKRLVTLSENYCVLIARAARGESIHKLGDIDATGVVNASDMFTLADYYLAGSEVADLDENGQLAIADIEIGMSYLGQSTGSSSEPIADRLRGQLIATQPGIGFPWCEDGEVTPAVRLTQDPVSTGIASEPFVLTTNPALPNCSDVRPNPHWQPTSNGCGSGGFSQWCAGLSPYLTNFTPCCDNHDMCYGTCGSDRGLCDSTFFACMLAQCASVTGTLARARCVADATAFYNAVHHGGGGAWTDGQVTACMCCDSPNPHPLCNPSLPALCPIDTTMPAAGRPLSDCMNQLILNWDRCGQCGLSALESKRACMQRANDQYLACKKFLTPSTGACN